MQLFFFNDTATTEIYTLSLHDALPICHYSVQQNADDPGGRPRAAREFKSRRPHQNPHAAPTLVRALRSEEHTSELQSQSNLVCRLLLEKKKLSLSCSTDASSPHPQSVY